MTLPLFTDWLVRFAGSQSQPITELVFSSSYGRWKSDHIRREASSTKPLPFRTYTRVARSECLTPKRYKRLTTSMCIIVRLKLENCVVDFLFMLVSVCTLSAFVYKRGLLDRPGNPEWRHNAENRQRFAELVKAKVFATPTHKTFHNISFTYFVDLCKGK